jgi:hypothetical protein
MFGKTCAVVSGSAALKGAGFGQEIDQHDIGKWVSRMKFIPKR